MAVRNIKLTICYDGSGFHGWQVQPEHDTIQQQVENALYRLTGQQIKVTGSSRTDAGVSALGQVASFFIESPIPTENFAKALTARLPDEIAVAEAVEVDASFNAISSTKSKYYRYTICTTKTRPVLKIRHCWYYPYDLEVFKSFPSAADERQSSVRTVTRCEVTAHGDEIYLDIEGDGFLYNMVRNVMGTLADIGRGRWEPEKINEILQAKDRTAAGILAPAEGLCLMRIDY